MSESQSEPAAELPLAGVKVLDYTQIMAGPFCGMLLADMGADVIKVEKPGGDDSRRMAPPFIEGESAAFLAINRNKRGIVLDLKVEGARQALHRMVAESDVLIQNFRRGTLERFGLGYEDARELNPALIYCHITGFGATGPYRDRPGFPGWRHPSSSYSPTVMPWKDSSGNKPSISESLDQYDWPSSALRMRMYR